MATEKGNQMYDNSGCASEFEIIECITNFIDIYIHEAMHFVLNSVMIEVCVIYKKVRIRNMH